MPSSSIKKLHCFWSTVFFHIGFKIWSAVCILIAQVQRALQLRIEEHARYLQKILAEQQKAGSAMILPQAQSLSTSSNGSKDSEQQPSPSVLVTVSAILSPEQPAESKTESSSTSLLSKHKATDSRESAPDACLKRIRLENKPEIASDEAVVENPVQ